MTLDRNPQAPRTDWKIASTNLVIDWTVPNVPGSCFDSRRVLGSAVYQAWTSLMPGVPHAGRDSLFRALRLTVLNAYFLTTDQAPAPIDLYAASVAMQPPRRYVYAGGPPWPVNMLQKSLSDTGCWAYP